MPRTTKKRKNENLSISNIQKAFNEMVRLRDISKLKKCCTCDEPYISCHKFDAGHFLPIGAYSMARFDERNVHLQCSYCNLVGQGEQSRYESFMIKNYGQEVIDELKSLRGSKVFTLRTYQKRELMTLIRENIKKLKQGQPHTVITWRTYGQDA